LQNPFYKGEQIPNKIGPQNSKPFLLIKEKKSIDPHMLVVENKKISTISD
jgi:hypothetical protein